MVDAIEVFVGFLSGLASGLAIQHARFKYSLRMGKVNRLLPYLESAYPIVERLSQHSEYAAKTQLEDNEIEFNQVMTKIAYGLDEYAVWFNTLKEDGMVPELDSIDRKLLDHLSGMFNHARLYQIHGTQYLSQQVQNLSKYCGICRMKLSFRLSR
jgi:hypothetical protein